MNKAGQVTWIKSLHFRLFAVFSVFLLGLVVAITVENSRRLDEILSRQSSDAQTFSTQRAAASIHANLTSWSAAIYTAVHLANRFGIENADGVADSLLASNSLSISFAIISQKEAGFQENLFRLTTDKNRHALLRGPTPLVVEQIRTLPPKEFLESTISAPRLFIPKGNESQNLVQLWIPFQLTLSGSDQKMWAGITFIGTTVASFLPHARDLTAVIFSDTGEALITPADVPLSKWRESFFAQTNDEFVKEFLGNLKSYQAKERANESGVLVRTSAIPIQGFGAALITEKQYGAEEEAIQAQVQRALMWSWILFLVATGLVYMIARKLTERIAAVVRVSAQLATGELNARVSEGSLDEVGVLTRSLNHLGEAITNLMKERERATIQEMELKTAHAVQEGLFPDEQFELRNGIATHYYFQSASKCAGDWWGRVQIAPHLELVIIGDALGHGVPAAIVAAQAFGYFVSAANRANLQSNTEMLSPANLISGFNDVLWRSGKGNATMTVFAALFDLKAMTLHFASAGHPQPFHMLHNNTTAKPKSLLARGTPCGQTKDPEILNQSISVQEGDRFFFFTDGLFEASNAEGEMLGREHLRKVFAATHSSEISEAAKTIEKALFDFTRDTPLADDVTFVMVEVRTQENSKE